jgi:flagellin-like protein
MVNIRKNKKAMTPIVAIILLLMMTVAAAGTSFYWLIKMQSEMQGGTEQYQENVFDRLASTVNWLDADYNSTSEVLTIYLQNVGTTNIALDNSSTAPTTTWILKDSEQVTVCESKFSGSAANIVDCTSGCGTSTTLNPSASTSISLDLSGTDCDVSNYAEDTLMRATIYFSGDATTAGTFET